jgi:hypothetical protein
MTEQEWLACRDPTPMLEFLWGKVSERKLRLFAVACCRRIWGLLDDLSRQAVEGAERFADGSSKLDPRLGQLVGRSQDFPPAANYPSWAAGYAAHPTMMVAYHHGQGHPCWCAAKYARWAGRDAGREQERSHQGLLVHCLFNPFRTITPEPGALTPTVVSLAHAAYDERTLPGGELDPHRLAVLSDALEEAGAGGELMAHLRAPGPHARGCWPLDLLTGRR